MEENINYRLSATVRDEIVEIVITGEITKATLDRLGAEVITILRDNNAKAVLVDARTAKGPHEITDAYFRARRVPSDVKILPVAIVEQPEHQDYQSFYETTAANMGQSMKYFTDIEIAKAWIRGRLERMRR